MRPIRNIFHSICFALVICLAASCGKKGAPKPPEVIAPSPVGQFSIKGSSEGVTLAWTAPTTDARGEELVNLSSFKIKRRQFNVEERGSYSTIAEIPVKTQGDTSGYGYLDADVEPGKRYDYIVVPVNEDGVEGRSQYGLRITFSGDSSPVETF